MITKTKAPAKTKIEAGTTMADLLASKTPKIVKTNMPKSNSVMTIDQPATLHPKANGAAKIIGLDDVLAFIETLPKGSDLNAIANKAYSKKVKKEAKPELVDVFRQAVDLHGFEDVKLAYAAVRKEQPTATVSETE